MSTRFMVESHHVLVMRLAEARVCENPTLRVRPGSGGGDVNVSMWDAVSRGREGIVMSMGKWQAAVDAAFEAEAARLTEEEEDGGETPVFVALTPEELSIEDLDGDYLMSRGLDTGEHCDDGWDL